MTPCPTYLCPLYTLIFTDSSTSLQDSLNSGKLKTPGATSEVMEQIVLLQKALEATGASPEEVAAVIAKATGPGLSDEAISEIMSKVSEWMILSHDSTQEIEDRSRHVLTKFRVRAGAAGPKEIKCISVMFDAHRFRKCIWEP